MAKSKISRVVVAGAGIGVLIAVIIPVMVFVFGVGNPNILPQDTDPNPFEIPVTCQQGEILNSEGTCIEIPTFEEPELICTIEPEELQRIADCELLTRDEPVVPSNTNLTVDECSQVNRESVEQCNVQIDKLIEDFLAQIEPEDDPVPPNGTETSIDDPYTQICDQNPSLIICEQSRSLDIVTRILKTDSEGNQSVSETTFNIPFTQLFVEDSSNIDFRTGSLQFETQIKGDPDFKYVGTGKVDLLIGSQSIFSQPINVKVDGIADSEGMVDLLFVSPTGGTSDLILFDFESNFDKFINEQTTTLRLNVIELNISGERDQDFALLNQDIFTMDIFRDDIQILIVDEEGIKSRVYPSDSRITVTGKTNASEEYSAGTTRIRTYDSIFYGNGRGCSQFMLISDVSKTPSSGLTATVPAPSLSVIILDGEGNIVNQKSGSTSYSFNELTRNANYTLKVGSLTSIPLDFGKSQETKSFTCTHEGTANTVGTSSTSGSTANCGYYTVSSGTTLNKANPITVKLNSLTCNFPQE